MDEARHLCVLGPTQLASVTEVSRAPHEAAIREAAARRGIELPEDFDFEQCSIITPGRHGPDRQLSEEEVLEETRRGEFWYAHEVARGWRMLDPDTADAPEGAD